MAILRYYICRTAQIAEDSNSDGLAAVHDTGRLQCAHVCTAQTTIKSCKISLQLDRSSDRHGSDASGGLQEKWSACKAPS